MTSIFFRNLYLGTKFSDEELENVPYPRFELHYHVMYKTIQAGSILGLCVFGPVIGLIRGRGNLAVIKRTAVKGAKIGAAIGVPLGPAFTEMTLSGKNETEERVYDRSYRIRYSTTQLRCDRWSTVGAAVGAAAGSYMGGAVLTGGVIGVAAGTLTAAVYNAKLAHDEIKKAPKRLSLKKEEESKEQ